jgi:hypothetical protein
MNKLTLALMAMPQEDRSKVFPVQIEVKDEAIFIRTGGREAWIEVDEDGNLIIHAYNKDIDEPVNVRIFADRVDIDTDRDNGLRILERRPLSAGLTSVSSD